MALEARSFWLEAETPCVDKAVERCNPITDKRNDFLGNSDRIRRKRSRRGFGDVLLPAIAGRSEQSRRGQSSHTRHGQKNRASVVVFDDLQFEKFQMRASGT